MYVIKKLSDWCFLLDTIIY